MKKTGKSILSALLTVCILVGCMAGISIPANAATGTRTVTWSSVNSISLITNGANEMMPKYTVQLSGGKNATPSPAEGLTQLVDAESEMEMVTYTADSGYYFDNLPDKTRDGIVVHRVDETTISVSGTPTDNVDLLVPNAVCDEWANVYTEEELINALGNTTKIRLCAHITTMDNFDLYSDYTLELDLNGNELTIYDGVSRSLCLFGPAVIIEDNSESGTGRINGGIKTYTENSLTRITGGTFYDPSHQTWFLYDNIEISGGRFSYKPDSTCIAEGCIVVGPDADDFYSVVACTFVPAKDPTYSEPGNIEHYKDDAGNLYVKDGDTDTYKPATLDEVTVPKLQPMVPMLKLIADSSKMYMNVYIPIPEGYELSDYTVTYGTDDPVQLTPYTDSDNGMDFGYFTITCAAKNMVDRKELVVTTNKDEDPICNHITISVRSYLFAIIHGQYDEAYKDVAKAMLCYGAAAQVVLDHETDETKLANYNIDGAGFDSLNDVSIPTTSTADKIVGAFSGLEYSTYYGMNMTYTYDTSLLVAFRINSGADKDAAKSEIASVCNVSEEAISLDTTGNYWIVTIKNIPVLGITSPQFTVNNISIIASDYLARVAGDSSKSEDLRNLCKALYAYYLAAKEVNKVEG